MEYTLTFFDYTKYGKTRTWINLEHANFITCNPASENEMKDRGTSKELFHINVYFYEDYISFFIDRHDLAEFEIYLGSSLHLK